MKFTNRNQSAGQCFALAAGVLLLAVGLSQAAYLRRSDVEGPSCVEEWGDCTPNDPNAPCCEGMTCIGNMCLTESWQISSDTATGQTDEPSCIPKWRFCIPNDPTTSCCEGLICGHTDFAYTPVCSPPQDVAEGSMGQLPFKTP